MSTFDLLTGEDFLTALLYGAVAAIVIAWAGAGARRVGKPPVRLAGLGFAAAAAAALRNVIDIPAEAFSALLLLALGGVLRSLTDLPFIGLLGAVPGAWLMAYQVDIPGPEWMPAFVFVAIVAGAGLGSDFDERYRSRGYGPPLLAAAVVGMFFTVPDTEAAVVVLGAALPLVFLGIPLPLASLGGPGTAAGVGLLVWIATLGGQGRPASVIGAAAGLGLLIAEPAGRLLLRTRFTTLDALGDDPSGVVVVGAAHFLVVVVTSRIAGLQSETVAAALIAGAVLVVAAVVTGRRGRRRE